MALIGLVRVGTDPQDARLQRQALEPICSRLFEETASRRRLINNRPGLLAAMSEVGDGDALTVTHAQSLSTSMVDGLETLLDLVDRGVTVKVLKGLAAGEHNGDSELLPDIRELRQLRRELQSSRIQAGIQAAREQGVSHGRPRTISDETQLEIRMRRDRGESLRSIAESAGVSIGTTHRVLTQLGPSQGTLSPRP
ncbi:recombinase family protein [Kocuria palustris]